MYYIDIKQKVRRVCIQCDGTGRMRTPLGETYCHVCGGKGDIIKTVKSEVPLDKLPSLIQHDPNSDRSG